MTCENVITEHHDCLFQLALFDRSQFGQKSLWTEVTLDRSHFGPKSLWTEVAMDLVSFATTVTESWSDKGDV